MNAEILSVGTELLLGDILNTNAQYLSKELAALGVAVYHQSVVGDNPERLREAYKLALSRADLVITTGGLGPTKDDLTKEIAAEYFNKKLILDVNSLNKISDYFKRMNRNLTESNKKQAYMPDGAIVVKNDNGTAPGCIIEENNKVVILMPGPPKELIPMFKDSIKPYLKKFGQGILVSKVLKVIGIGESFAADKISDLLDNENPTVAPYAKDVEVNLRITAKGNTEEEAKALIIPVEEEIRARLGENVYGVDDDVLEGVVAKMLIDNNLTISTAESCTGGLVAATLINYPGISSAFMEGAVTYSNEAKINRLGVKKETLDSYGAVSSETAAEMAEGIAKAARTNIGISTTGIAGPDGGTAEKPVGLVYIGLYINGKVQTKKVNFLGSREKIRNRVVSFALDWLRRELL